MSTYFGVKMMSIFREPCLQKTQTLVFLLLASVAASIGCSNSNSTATGPIYIESQSQATRVADTKKAPQSPPPATAKSSSKTALDIEAEVLLRQRKDDYDVKLKEWEQVERFYKQIKIEIDKLPKDSEQPAKGNRMSRDELLRLQSNYERILAEKPFPPTLDSIKNELRTRNASDSSQSKTWDSLRSEVLEDRAQKEDVRNHIEQLQAKINKREKEQAKKVIPKQTQQGPKFRSIIDCNNFLRQNAPELYEKANVARNRWQEASYVADLPEMNAAYRELQFLLGDTYLMFYWDVDDIMKNPEKTRKILLDSYRFQLQQLRNGNPLE
jgi:hypothetical protein